MKTRIEILPKYGLVASLDILGYKQLIRTQSTQRIVPIIQESFIDTVKKTSEGWKQLARGPFRDYVPKYLIFSDSILLTSQLPQNELRQRAPVFILFCQQLMANLFAQGLPLRGAVSVGQYYLSERPPIFAGLSIVEAHELANSLELAACALTLTAEKALQPWLPKPLLEYYAVPIKANGNQNLYLLDYFYLLKAQVGGCRQKVIDSFSAHNKGIPNDVIRKVNNTVEFFEHCENKIDAAKPKASCPVRQID